MWKYAALVVLFCSSLLAQTKQWPVFQAGQRVEIDQVCTGTWVRATIIAAGPDARHKNARTYSAKFDDGHQWTFSGPGIIAPCIRAMSASAAAPVAPLAGSSGPRLQGLYLQLQSTGTAYAYVHYYFWPDGRVCNGLPSGGLDHEPADFGSVQKQRTCGQYRINGNKMSLQWQGDAAPHDVRIANFQKDSFDMNGYATAKVASFGSGQRLNGSYSATLVGSQTRKQTYAFHNDGTYQMNDQPVTSRDGAPRHEQGSYRFSGNSLEVSGKRLTAYPLPNGAVSIEGTAFKKD